MALVVGTDTYISAGEATSYIEQHYTSTDAKRIAWAALSESDQEVILRRACALIERLRVIGFKALPTQTLQFPRALYSEASSSIWAGSFEYIDGVHVQREVPEEVKNAQVEIALQQTVGVDARIELQRQGVKSFRLGELSESYGGSKAMAVVISADAYDLLAPYLSGGFDIT